MNNKRKIIIGTIASITALTAGIVIIKNCFVGQSYKTQMKYLSKGWESAIVQEIVDEDIPVPKGYTYIEGDKRAGVIVEDNATSDKYMWIPYSNVSEEASDMLDEIQNTYGDKMIEDNNQLDIEEIGKYDGFFVMLENEDNNELYEQYKTNFIEQYSTQIPEDELKEIASQLNEMSYNEYKEYYESKTGEKLNLSNPNNISNEELSILKTLNSDEYNSNKSIRTGTLTKEQLACIQAYEKLNGKKINYASSLKTFTVAKSSENISNASAISSTTNEVVVESKKLSNGKDALIPNGFTFEQYITDKDNKNISIKIKDGDNLSFVWIPVDNIDKLKKATETLDEKKEKANVTVVKTENDTSKETSQYEEMIKSIEKYGGYYVSESELSLDNNGNPANKFRSMEYRYTDDNGVEWYGIGDGEYYRNGIGKEDFKWPEEIDLTNYDRAEVVANELYENSTTVTSHLMFGDEYDYMLQWIMETNDSSIENQMMEDSSDIGKYAAKKDLQGNSENQGLWNVTYLNGIFGLGGNLWDITQETQGERIAARGGSFDSQGKENPIVYKRWIDKTNWSYKVAGNTKIGTGQIGMRVSLYLKLDYKESDELNKAKEEAKKELHGMWNTAVQEYGDTIAVNSIEEYGKKRIDNEESDVILDKILDYVDTVFNDNYGEAVNTLKNNRDKYPGKIDEWLNILNETSFENEGVLTDYTSMVDEWFNEERKQEEDKTTPKPKDEQNVEIDKFKFTNSEENFNNTYEIDDTLYNRLIGKNQNKPMSNRVQAVIRQEMEKEWIGSCHGMSSIFLLNKFNKFNPSDWQADAKLLRDMQIPKNNVGVNNIIQFYQLMQYLPDIYEIPRGEYFVIGTENEEGWLDPGENVNDLLEYNRSVTEEKTKYLIGECLKKGEYPLIGVMVTKYENKEFIPEGHTLAPTSLEIAEGEYWKYKINCYDPNVGKDVYFYVSENFQEVNFEDWIAKYYPWIYNKNVYISDIEEQYHYNCINPTNGTYNSVINTDYTEDYAIINGKAIAEMHNANGDKYIENGRLIEENEDKYKQKIMMNLSDKEDNQIALQLLENSDEYTIVSNEGIDASFIIGDAFESVKTESGTEAKFNEEGKISFDSKESSYEATLAINNEAKSIKYGEVSITGKNAEKVELANTEKGITVNSDNLKDLKITVNDEAEEIQKTVNTDEGSILLSEEDNSINISIDEDRDGTYETTIEKIEPMEETSKESKDTTNSKTWIYIISAIIVFAITITIVVTIIIKRK